MEFDANLFGELAVIFTIKNNWAKKRQSLRNKMNALARNKKVRQAQKDYASKVFRDFNSQGREMFDIHFNSRFRYLLKCLEARLLHDANSGYYGLMIGNKRYSPQEIKQKADEYLAISALEKALAPS